MRALVLLTLCAALPPWSYADDSGCLQTYTNYAAMWVTMKGTGIDTGHPSGKIQSGETCAKLGYTEKADTLKDLPAVFRALYVDVTAWQKPQVVLFNALTLAAAAETCAGPHEHCDPGGSGFEKIDCCPGSICARQVPAGEGGSYICLGSYQLAIEDEHRFPVLAVAAEPACKDAFPPKKCDMACFQRCCAARGGVYCIVHACGCSDVTSLSCTCPQEEGMTLEQAKVEEAAEMVLADAGACTADDATKSSTVKFSCDAVKCAKSNFFKLDPTAACIAKEDGVSSGCANCFGQVSQCVVKNCAVKCLVDPTAPACQACGHAACDDLAKSCTGLATLPPDAKDCSKAEANFLVV